MSKITPIFDKMALYVSIFGLAAALAVHLISYFIFIAWTDTRIWLALLASLLTAVGLYYPAYWSYIKAVYEHYEWEWKPPESMNLQEKHRFWKLQVGIWKPRYSRIGMPYTPSWMRVAAVPVLYATLIYFGVVLIVSESIKSSSLLLNSLTLFVAALFFADIALYYSRTKRYELR